MTSDELAAAITGVTQVVESTRDRVEALAVDATAEGFENGHILEAVAGALTCVTVTLGDARRRVLGGEP